MSCVKKEMCEMKVNEDMLIGCNVIVRHAVPAPRSRTRT